MKVRSTTIPAHVIARFLKRYKPGEPIECWEWPGSRLTRGYGYLSVGPKGSSLKWLAHRVSHAVFVRQPGRLNVLHTCDNPPCVNPAHLFLGTHKDNAEDKVTKGRSCFGQRNSQSKLTEAEVLRMRSEYGDGTRVTQRALADVYGVSQVVVGAVVRGATWRHVGGLQALHPDRKCKGGPHARWTP